MLDITEVKPVAPSVMTAAVVAATSGAAALWALWGFAPPGFLYKGTMYVAPINWVVGQFFTDLHSAKCGVGIELLELDCRIPVAWHQSVAAFGLETKIGLRLTGVVLTTVAVFVTTCVVMMRGAVPRDGLRHIAGARLIKFRDAANALRRHLAPRIARSGAGFWLAPGVQLSFEDESENCLLVGMQGSGKTMILRALIEQSVARGDRALLHDVKGDVTQGLPTKNFVLIAPHDARTAAWDVAQDITSWRAADELATRIIRETNEPTWSDAARQVLAAILVHHITCSPGKWSWGDVYSSLLLPAGELKDMLERAKSPAARFIELTDDGAVSKTTFGILVTLWSTALTLVRPLAEAWKDPKSPRFSIRRWLTTGGMPWLTVVIQRNAAYPELSSMLAGALFDTLAGVLADPALAIDRKRRIALFLDELPQLGQLKRLAEMLSIGREKGLLTVAAVQDPNQLDELYGREVAAQLLTLLGTKIVLKLPRGSSSKRVCDEWIGERRVGWVEKTRSHSSHSGGSGHGSTTTNSVQRETTLPVFPPERIEGDLGLKRVGKKTVVRGLILGLGACFLLDWPLTIWRKRRPAHKPAAWLKE